MIFIKYFIEYGDYSKNLIYNLCCCIEDSTFNDLESLLPVLLTKFPFFLNWLLGTAVEIWLWKGINNHFQEDS